jgi:Glycosyltransferase family 87
VLDVTAPPTGDSRSWAVRRLSALRVALRVGIYALLPFLLISTLLATAISSDILALDFHNAFRPAAQAVLHGMSPYVALDDPELTRGTAFVYPPVSAFLLMPFALLPSFAADVLVSLVLLGLVPLILWAGGVRDWRCYGIAFLWAPVFSAIQTANLSIPLALGAALTWRHRDRLKPLVAVAGLSLAAKIFLWPLVAWLWASGRRRPAILSVAVATAFMLTTWAILGFAGLAEYVPMLRRLTALEEKESYSSFALALDSGLGETPARALALALSLALLVATITVTSRGDERGGYVLAITTALAASPIIWLHYFTLLLVPVAITRPRLSLPWFLPLALWACSGTGNGAPWQTILLLGVTAAVVATCLVEPLHHGRRLETVTVER